MINLLETGIGYGGEATILGELLLILFVFVAILSLLMFLSWGFLFKKAGYAFWKAFIPIYNVFIYHEIIGLSKLFTFIYIIAGGLTATGIGAIVVFIMNIVCASRTARAFNLGTLWAIAIYFFGPLAYMVIGLSKNITYAYSRKTPQLVPVNNTPTNMNFDPNTGAPINPVQPSNSLTPNVSYDPNTGQPITNNVTETLAPTQQVNSDLPDSIESIIIKQ